MDSSEFRAAAHQMIDYVIDYLENIRERLVSQLNIETKKKKQSNIFSCLYLRCDECLFMAKKASCSNCETGIFT